MKKIEAFEKWLRNNREIADSDFLKAIEIALRESNEVAFKDGFNAGYDSGYELGVIAGQHVKSEGKEAKE